MALSAFNILDGISVVSLPIQLGQLDVVSSIHRDLDTDPIEAMFTIVMLKNDVKMAALSFLISFEQSNKVGNVARTGNVEVDEYGKISFHLEYDHKRLAEWDIEVEDPSPQPAPNREAKVKRRAKPRSQG